MNEVLQSRSDHQQQVGRHVRKHRCDFRFSGQLRFNFSDLLFVQALPQDIYQRRLFSGIEFLNLVLDGCKAHAAIIRRVLRNINTSNAKMKS
jgi:hypothetical protein